jgi:hypothetical protein
MHTPEAIPVRLRKILYAFHVRGPSCLPQTSNDSLDMAGVHHRLCSLFSELYLYPMDLFCSKQHEQGEAGYLRRSSAQRMRIPAYG